MDLEEKKLLEENNMLLKTLVKLKVFEIINEIEKIGVENMENITTVAYYRELIGGLLLSCGYSSPLYSSYGEKVYKMKDKLYDRYKELLSPTKSLTIKEEFNIQ